MSKSMSKFRGLNLYLRDEFDLAETMLTAIKDLEFILDHPNQVHPSLKAAHLSPTIFRPRKSTVLTLEVSCDLEGYDLGILAVSIDLNDISRGSPTVIVKIKEPGKDRKEGSAAPHPSVRPNETLCIYNCIPWIRNLKTNGDMISYIHSLCALLNTCPTDHAFYSLSELIKNQTLRCTKCKERIRIHYSYGDSQNRLANFIIRGKTYCRSCAWRCSICYTPELYEVESPIEKRKHFLQRLCRRCIELGARQLMTVKKRGNRKSLSKVDISKRIRATIVDKYVFGKRNIDITDWLKVITDDLYVILNYPNAVSKDLVKTELQGHNLIVYVKSVIEGYDLGVTRVQINLLAAYRSLSTDRLLRFTVHSAGKDRVNLENPHPNAGAHGVCAGDLHRYIVELIISAHLFPFVVALCNFVNCVSSDHMTSLGDIVGKDLSNYVDDDDDDDDVDADWDEGD